MSLKRTISATFSPVSDIALARRLVAPIDDFYAPIVCPFLHGILCVTGVCDHIAVNLGSTESLAEIPARFLTV
jgi:hypothetical protein